VRPTCVRCCYTVRRTAIHIAFASGRFARDAGLGGYLSKISLMGGRADTKNPFFPN